MSVWRHGQLRGLSLTASMSGVFPSSSPKSFVFCVFVNNLRSSSLTNVNIGSICNEQSNQFTAALCPHGHPQRSLVDNRNDAQLAAGRAQLGSNRVMTGASVNSTHCQLNEMLTWAWWRSVGCCPWPCSCPCSGTWLERLDHSRIWAATPQFPSACVPQPYAACS